MCKKAILLLCVLLCCSLAGCKKSGEEVRKQKEETERQRLRREAVKAYENLAKEFPESPHANQAQEKANALKAKDVQKKK